MSKVDSDIMSLLIRLSSVFQTKTLSLIKTVIVDLSLRYCPAGKMDSK